MKPLIVYCSRTGNTRRIAETIARTLSADCMTVDEVQPAGLAERALIGLGSGVYWTNLDRRIYGVARGIPIGTPVFAFSTSGFRGRWWTDWYHSRASRRFGRLGITLIGWWHCPGQDNHFLSRPFHFSWGRPNERDMQGTKEFAMQMADRCRPPPGWT